MLSSTLMRRIFTLSIANTTSALHYFLVAVIASSYLGEILSDAQVGIVFSLSAALMILGFVLAPLALTHLSVRRVAFSLGVVDLVTLLLLIANPPTVLAIALIALQGAIAPLIGYTLDLFLENATSDEGTTGHMRGLFLTSTNIALVAAPLLIGLFLDTTNDYSRIFIAAAAALSIFMFIIVTRKRHLIDRKITYAAPLFRTLHCLLFNREIRSVLIAQTFLQSLFVWTSLYVPLYLHASLGLSWATLGPVFALMMLPSLLIELPVGFVEDRIRGARTIMAVGFAISAVSVAAVSFIATGTSVGVIVLILVLSRVGASLVEATSETSFFRSVDGRDAESVSFFRMTRPLARLIAPLIATPFLVVLPLQFLFIPIGAILLFGIPFALNIRKGA